MRVLFLLALTICLTFTQEAAEEEKPEPPFLCTKICGTVLRPPHPPTEFKEETIKNNDQEMQKFLSCHSKCLSLMMKDEKKEAEVLPELQKMTF